ncbi:hypothetical protein JD844_013346 [Phrynosoma platyrhinos]|uniref:RING-type domain-containing protein n=1 Tax=Phrynosoma platyrhinos TaxID=52577 RepID=A0ABQ7TLI2_PHRPL|nr:hypothetical protein JD844_013346 [Phrynosoma platyrhinos]
MSAEQQLQQRLLRSRLRASSQLHPGGPLSLGGGGGGGSLAPPPPPPPLLLPPLSPPSPPDSPPPGTTPAEIPAGPRYPSETWCSLCRVYCPDPVCLPCGHNFCTACIGQRLGEPKLSISCLECGATARKRNLRPIKPPPLLASLGSGGSERTKRARLEASPAAAAPPPPPPPLTSTPVAAAAAAVSAAPSPPVAPAATATAAPSPPAPPPTPPPTTTATTTTSKPFLFAQERVQAQLEILKQEKNTLWSQKLTGERKIQEYMEKVKTERQEIVSEFEHLHQFLKDQEQRLLTQLEEIDKEIERQKDEMVTKLSEELSRLGDVITEMEAKCKQPASEFLQVRLAVNREISCLSFSLA